MLYESLQHLKGHRTGQKTPIGLNTHSFMYIAFYDNFVESDVRGGAKQKISQLNADDSH